MPAHLITPVPVCECDRALKDEGKNESSKNERAPTGQWRQNGAA